MRTQTHCDVAPVLYVDYLLVIHYVILSCLIRIKSVSTWKIIRFETQPESDSLTEMSVATRKAGRATVIIVHGTIYKCPDHQCCLEQMSRRRLQECHCCVGDPQSEGCSY